MTVPLAMRVLVDTRAFLWIASDSPHLSKTAAAVFLDRNNERYLSAASAWEIAIKYAVGRLPLPERPDIFVRAMREASGIAFDRMLVAQAIVHGMTILTPDPEIEQYAVRVLW